MTLCTVIMQASYPPRPPPARTLYSRPWNDQAVAPLVGSTLGHFLGTMLLLEFLNFDTFRKTDIPYIETSSLQQSKLRNCSHCLPGDHAGALEAELALGLAVAEHSLAGGHQPEPQVAVAVDGVAGAEDAHLEAAVLVLF